MNDFLAFADRKCVNESVHRFGVGGGMPTGDDDRVGLVALCRTDGNARQVEDVEGVCVESLIGQGKADQVEAGQGVF